jgi:imidazolonepropionase-like amidohydrolase
MHTIDLAKLAEESNHRPLRLRVGQLIDGESNQPRREVDIVFDAKEIHSVGAPEGQADATLAEQTLLPCLIEAHAHMFLDGAPVSFQQRDQYLKESTEWMLARARKRWAKIIQCGVAAIRDAGDKHNVGLTLSRECKEGAATPFIDSPGAAIHHKGRYGSFMGEPIEDHGSAAACAKARIDRGADRVKLLVSGIINFKEGKVTTPPQLSIDEVREIVRVARGHNKHTFAHASGSEGVEHSIEGGVNTVEHGFFITDEQLRKMRDLDIAWVPTFAPVQLQIDRAADLAWDNVVVNHLKQIIDAHQKSLVKAHAMGVKILAGSDAGSCGVPHGVGLLQEMQQMEQAGMPSMAVLQSATSVSATTLAFPIRIGRVAPGYRSRFILTRHDPLKTVANLQKAKTIVFDGRAIDCPADLSTDGL